jgi:sterol desaturase/sphingolipid hydroxylase (fatty acid hydroxylase superfamily)
MKMLEPIWALIMGLPEFIGAQLLIVLAYPLWPSQRIFFPNLITSMLFAIVIYGRIAARAATPDEQPRSLVKFLFPTAVWQHPSAWLDVRYFFFHQIVRLVIYGAFMSAVSTAVFQGSTEVVDWLSGGPLLASTASAGPLTLAYFLLSALAIDFVAYATHVLQHRIPILWEFHKLHHSATVMHPLTNYREHPVDNIFYAIATGACIGFMMALITSLLGYVPSVPTIFGVGVLAFAFNMLGYNLRHSHIWLRWPGKLSYLFGSPAHHQVHHSCYPEHIDKNFAFMFPFWDLLFGTYCVPETNDHVKFGINETDADEYHSCLDMYYKPLRSAFCCAFPRLKKQPDKKSATH